MKKTTFICFALLIFVTTTAQKHEVMPKAQFDTALVKQMLAYGKATITGIAATRDYDAPNRINNLLGVRVVGKKRLAPEGTVVTMFPVTPYFEEYYRLKNHYKNSKNKIAVLSKEAFHYRLETKTDKNGRFTFTKIKPGKYYIETVFGYTGRTGTDVEVERTDYYNGYGNYINSDSFYKTYYYNYRNETVESKFIEIKNDGETKDIKL